MKNQSRTIKTNPELYRVVMGVQVVTGDSQEEVIIFRDTHFIIIYIYHHHHHHHHHHHNDNCLAGKTASLVERLTVSTSWRRRASAQRVQTKCSWKHRDKNEERQRQRQSYQLAGEGMRLQKESNLVLGTQVPRLTSEVSWEWVVGTWLSAWPIWENTKTKLRKKTLTLTNSHINLTVNKIQCFRQSINSTKQ